MKLSSVSARTGLWASLGLMIFFLGSVVASVYWQIAVLDMGIFDNAQGSRALECGMMGILLAVALALYCGRIVPSPRIKQINEAVEIITFDDVEQAPSFKPHSDGAELVTPTCLRMIHALQDAIFSAYSFIELTEAGKRCDGNSVDAHETKSLALKSKALRMLADSITKAAQAATQIAASSQQQLAGMDQVALAMENIKQASAQNIADTNQAEAAAAHTLNEIGHKLRQMVERYGVDTSPQLPAWLETQNRPLIICSEISDERKRQ